MLDPKQLRAETAEIAKQLQRRGFVLDVEILEQLEAERKTIQTRTQELQNQRNTRSKSIGKAKAAGEDIEPLKAEVAKLGTELAVAEKQLGQLQEKLDLILWGIPNLLHEDVPDGLDESENVELSKWGTPRDFDFEPLDF